MKKAGLLLLIVFNSFFAKAQITGSDTVCPGYIYTYKVQMAGAATFTWTLPNGWYFISGQGTDSVKVNCNQTVDSVCVIGFDTAGNAVDTVCKKVFWGGGGAGWRVEGQFVKPCYSIILSVVPYGTCGGKGCGSGYKNPNVVFAAFDKQWPTGNYLGIVNGSNIFKDKSTGNGTWVYVYMVDTTFGVNNMILIKGGIGGCPVNNTYHLPYYDNKIWLYQYPFQICIGDTFSVFANTDKPTYMYWASCGWNVWPTCVNEIYSDCDHITLTFDSTCAKFSTNISVDASFYDQYGCNYNGTTYVNFLNCAKPNALFVSSDSSFCLGPSNCINFFDHSTNNPTSWKWSFPGGVPNSSIQKNPTNICYYSPGTYSVSLIVSNNYGSDTITLPNHIKVYSNPPTPQIIQSNDTLYSVNNYGYSSYSWYYNNTIIPGAIDSFLVINKTGNYKLQVTNSYGCTNNVTINITSIVPLASFQSSDSSLCNEIGNPCISFTDHSTNTPTTWHWLFPGATHDTSTQQNPTNICYTQPGTYPVTLIVTNAAGSDTLTVSPMITVGSNPASPVLTVSNDTIYCRDTTCCVSTYQWYRDGNIISGATDSFYVFSQNGTYAVQITDSIGCSRLSDGVVITGLTPGPSPKERGVTVYPNPAGDEFTVYGLQFTVGAVLEVYNVFGEKVYNRQIEAGNSKPARRTPDSFGETVNCKQFAAGLYFIRVSDDKGSYAAKFIKE